MGRGVGMGVGSAMMSDTSVGVSQMGLGSGSVGSPFAKQGGAILGHAGDSGKRAMMMIVVEKEEEAENRTLKGLR